MTWSDTLDWTRRVTVLHPTDDRPLLVLHDTFAGTDAAVAKVSTLNLMADGAVETPAGPVIPEPRKWSNATGDHQFPSVGPILSLPAGVNRLGFTGQWGVDFDVFTVADHDREAYIGNWAHDSQPGTAWREFEQAHGRPFEERQHILRIRGTGASTTVLLPFRHGQRPEGLTVTQEGTDLLVATATETHRIGQNFYAYAGPARTILATFDDQPAAAHGISIAGGPTEVVIEADRLLVTAHGMPGPRQLQVPGSWSPPPPLLAVGDRWELDYQQTEPLRRVARAEPAPVLADAFADRLELTGGSLLAFGSNHAATKEPGEPDHLGWRGGRSVWWTWTAPQSGLCTVTTAGSDFDTMLAIYAGEVINGLSLVAANDDASTNQPTSLLTFDFASPSPSGAVIDPATGRFSWTPSEGQGPGVYSVSILVSDSDAPSLSSTITFTVTVREVKAAPVLELIGDFTVQTGQSLTFMVSASDPEDTPSNTVVLSASNLPPAPGAGQWTETGCARWSRHKRDPGLRFRLGSRTSPLGVRSEARDHDGSQTLRLYVDPIIKASPHEASHPTSVASHLPRHARSRQIPLVSVASLGRGLSRSGEPALALGVRCNVRG